MNTYEALIVFKPVVDVENTENVVKNVENLVTNLKGKVLKLERVGRKRLAYEISKCKDGFIITLWMELDPSAVTEFKKTCQMNEDILRLTLLRMSEKFDLATVGTTTSVAYGGAREREFHPRGDREHRGGDREHRGDREFRGGGDREHRGGDRHHEPRGEHREHRPPVHREQHNPNPNPGPQQQG